MYSLWQPQIFQVQAKLLTIRPVFPYYLSVSYNYDSKYYIHNKHVPFALSSKFRKNWSTLQFSDQTAQVFNFRSRSAISNIMFRINEFDLLWGPNFIALAIYFIFGTKFTWNEGIDTCFNVEGVLLGLNFDFFRGYLVITACYLVITARYLMATGGYCSLPVVIARSRFCYERGCCSIWSYILTWL